MEARWTALSFDEPLFALSKSKRKVVIRCRCGNVAAILELDEHLEKKFTVFEAAPQVIEPDNSLLAFSFSNAEDQMLPLRWACVCLCRKPAILVWGHLCFGIVLLEGGFRSMHYVFLFPKSDAFRADMRVIFDRMYGASPPQNLRQITSSRPLLRRAIPSKYRQ